MTKTRVVILGAGPAGLGLAQQLLARGERQGLTVEVIEARDHVGGLAASFEYGGVTMAATDYTRASTTGFFPS